MVICYFECLPNELVLHIFNYLSTIDRWFAFYTLNIRLNNLLESDFTQIDLSNCRRSQFAFACQHISTRIQTSFSLKVSLKRLNQSIDQLFIQLQSHNVNSLLESMTLVDVTRQSIQGVIQHLSGLSNLRSLTIFHDSAESTQNCLRRILSANIISLEYLKIDYIGEYRWFRSEHCPTENCSTTLNIKELVLKVPIMLSTFRRLLQLLPQISSIEVLLKRRWGDNSTDTPSIRQCSPDLKRLVLILSYKDGSPIYFEDISKLLQELPQLHTFWCTSFFCDNADGQQYQDGHIWEHFIRTYLPNLIDFRLNIGVERSSLKYHPMDVIKSFCTPFWTEEKKWCFVADHPENNADTIDLYSLPPPEPSTIIFCPYSRWISNLTNPNFNHVKTLGLSPRSYTIKDEVIESRYYSNVKTVRPPGRGDLDCVNYISSLSDYVNLRSIQNLKIHYANLVAVLAEMTNLIKLEFHCSCEDLECFKKFTFPILQVKQLILAESSLLKYYLNQADLSTIKNLFPNLEYLEINMIDVKDLPDLINGMSRLIYIIIYYKQEENNKKKIEEWIENYAETNKFKSSLEENRIALWLY